MKDVDVVENKGNRETSEVKSMYAYKHYVFPARRKTRDSVIEVVDIHACVRRKRGVLLKRGIASGNCVVKP